MDRRLWVALAGIAAAGLALRIWYALAVAGEAPLVGDGLEIHGIANTVADGRGYITPIVAPGEEPLPTAHKPPLYPLVLSLFFALGADGYVAHHVVTAVIGSATVLVVAALALRLAGRGAAVLAAAIAAVYPVFVVMDASLRSETLYTLLVALAMLAAYRALDRPSGGRLVQLGAVIGLAALTRSEALALLALFAVPVAWRSGKRGRSWRLALVAVACGLVLAPWLIRCWIVFDRPVLISTNSGDLIAGANCDATYSGTLLGGWSFECGLAADDADGNEAEIAERLRDRGLRYAREHADRLPAVVGARVLRPWGLLRPEEQIALRAAGEGQRRTADWLGLWVFWGLAVPAFAGVAVVRRRRQPVFILLAPFLLVLLVSVTAYGALRFRAPADVSVIVLAAVALDTLRRGLRVRPAR